MGVRKIENLVNKLLKTVESARIDSRKFDDGNMAAGIRARKIFQAIKEESQFARNEILRLKKRREDENS